MDTQAIAQALKQVLAEIQKADGMALKGGGMKVEVETAPREGVDMEECESCMNGTCTDPAHMSDTDMEEMARGGY